VRRRSAGWSGPARLISPLVVLGIWQLTNTFSLISASRLPPPSLVWSTGVHLVSHSSAAYGTLQGAMLVSSERWALGFGAGFLVAVTLAGLAGLNRIGELAIDPLVQMVRTLPLFGLIPVFIVLFGVGDFPKLLIVGIGGGIPVYLNTYSGIRTIDGRLYELAQAFGWTRAETVRHIVVPGALPQMLVGLRQGMGLAWLALVVAEQVNANSGLGFIIDQATTFYANDVIFVALFMYTLLGLITDSLVRTLERRALIWRPDLVIG
jgi:sulfonate transport system permease protein